MNLCCILNYPPHYREQIYRLMEAELDCDFYFGDIEKGSIRPIEYSHFKKQVKNLKTIRLPFGFNWIDGAVSLMFKPHKKYLFTGEPFCISTWICLFLAKLFGKKTYLWTHGWYGHEGKLKTKVKKYFFNLADGLFLYGDYAKRMMVQTGFKESKLSVVYNSLSYDLQMKIRLELKSTTIYRDHFGNDDPVIFFTGRLTSVKKLDQLIEAHKIISSKQVNFNVVILGDGPEKENLQELVGRKELTDRYWFYGACYDEAIIGEMYYNAAACVSPGNVGLTAIHSLMYGCPVITHSDFTQQMPEFETIISRVTGDFFECGNIDSLAEVLQSWLINNCPKSERLIKGCYNVIDEKFNPYYQISVIKYQLSTGRL